MFVAYSLPRMVIASLPAPSPRPVARTSPPAPPVPAAEDPLQPLAASWRAGDHARVHAELLEHPGHLPRLCLVLPDAAPELIAELEAAQAAARASLIAVLQRREVGHA